MTDKPFAFVLPLLRQRSWLVALASLIMLLINLISQYPGVPTGDSDNQYAQAVSGRFNDWHPPIMAWLWSKLLWVADGSGPLFAIHILCYWLGFGLIALGMGRIGRNRSAWTVVALGGFLPFVATNALIFSDVGMAVAFLTAFGLCFFYRSQGGRIPLVAASLAGVCLVYGVLVRANAVFAAAPLVVYAACPSSLRRPVHLFASCLAVILITVPVSRAFNRWVLHARPVYAEVSLMLFDVVGTAFFSRDLSVLSEENSQFSLESVTKCYSPVVWDTLMWREGCHFFFGRHPTTVWIQAVLKHPLAYVEHRLAHFNSELYFLVPRHHAYERALNIYGHHSEDSEGVPWDRDPLITPMFALVLGLAVVTMSFPKSAIVPGNLQIASFCLALSGTSYSTAYLLIGVYSSPRYHYWSIVAILIATILYSSEHYRLMLRSRIGWVCIASVTTALIATFAVPAIYGDALLPS
jgi:hypothetical protein